MQEPFPGKNVLVTGINGFVGQYVARALLEEGYHVIGIDLTSECQIKHRNIDYHQVDITQPTQIEDKLKGARLNALVHLAALVHKKGKDLSLDNYMKVNNEAALSIAEIALRHGAQTVLFASTIEVYGEPNDDVIDEETPCAPESYYGQSKLLAEKEITKLAKKHGVRFGIMRFAPVYASDFMLNLNKRIFLPKKVAAYYFRDGDYSYNFCSIHNITDFVLGFLEVEIASGVYIMSDNENIKAIDFINSEKRQGNLRRVIKLPYGLTKATIGLIEGVTRKVSNQEPYLSLYNFRKLFRSTKYSSKKMETALGGIKWDYKNTLYNESRF